MSPENYYDEAEIMLKNNDLLEFYSNINSSVLLAKKDNNQKILAKASYLRAKGLVYFSKHHKAIKFIEEALNYNDDELKTLNLLKLKGQAKGYLGKVDESLSIFMDLISKTNNTHLLAGLYINIAWVYLTLKKEKSKENLNRARYYLDLAQENFHSLSNKKKWRILYNYSTYYYYLKDFDKAIEYLEQSIQFCDEKYLCIVYNNLAELYITIAKEENSGISELVDEYLNKAEKIATKFKMTKSLGYTYYFRAEADMVENQIFTVLDNLSLAYDLFREAESTVMACDCLVRINQIMDDHKHSSLESIKKDIENKCKDTEFFNIL